MPVSSSAQLTLLPWLARWPAPAHRTATAAALHAGSALGLLWVQRHDVRARGPVGLLTLGLASAPAAAAGARFSAPVERRTGRPAPTALFLAASGLLLARAERRGRRTPAPHPRGDLPVAAVAQVAALVPGVSRQGAVLTALRARGVPRERARRTADLTALPVTAGAAVWSLREARQDLSRADAVPLLVGAATAAVTAAGAHRLARTRVGAVLTGTPTVVAYRLVVAGLVARRLMRG